MRNFVDCIINAEAFTGDGSKAAKAAEIEKLRDNPVSYKLLEEAFSNYRVFGIKKFNKPVSYAEIDADVDIFLELLDDLHERRLTGNAAKAAVTSTLSYYTNRTSLILERVLLKDVKAGFSADTVNKVLCGKKHPLPGENPVIPWYSCQLAKKMPSIKDPITGKKTLTWKDWPTKDKPKIIEAKYDGTRNNAFIDCSLEFQNEQVINRSRSGKPSSHIDGLFDEEMLRLQEIVGEPFILDGETMGKDWNSTLNAKGSSEAGNKAKKNLLYYAFDIVLMETWVKEGVTPPQLDRSNYLEKILKEANCTKIIKTKSAIVYSKEEANAFYEEMLDEGFEGAIFKETDAVYVWDRHESWMKWKPVDFFDCAIMSFYPGKPGTRLEFTMGGVNVVGEDENGMKFSCRVGGGWKDKQRNDMWNNQEKYLGKMIEIEADPNVSILEGREINSLRWGQFKRFREDKD